ncbi:hypothetical protein E2R52_08950 [Pantoea ananatis]|nr:hypothetical protein B9Q16_04795 [Pantoea ananatis]QAB32114.1 hypothetical protein EPK90_21080 [Pantoea ananatis]RQN05355.1 hypothetical protein EHQ51_11020 [Pantoea ananatis]TDL55079.1 hypothetical protein E2R52_08950 [Pantoea ananatis]
MYVFVKFIPPILTIVVDNENCYRQNSHYHNAWKLFDNDSIDAQWILGCGRTVLPEFPDP